VPNFLDFVIQCGYHFGLIFCYEFTRKSSLGMLNIFATGGARIEGQVSADGDPSTSNTNYGGGGGSGGTIRIKTPHVDGAGNISVAGGNGEFSSYQFQIKIVGNWRFFVSKNAHRFRRSFLCGNDVLNSCLNGLTMLTVIGRQ